MGPEGAIIVPAQGAATLSAASQLLLRHGLRPSERPCRSPLNVFLFPSRRRVHAVSGTTALPDAATTAAQRPPIHRPLPRTTPGADPAPESNMAFPQGATPPTAPINIGGNTQAHHEHTHHALLHTKWRETPRPETTPRPTPIPPGRSQHRSSHPTQRPVSEYTHRTPHRTPQGRLVYMLAHAHLRQLDFETEQKFRAAQLGVGLLSQSEAGLPVKKTPKKTTLDGSLWVMCHVAG